VLLWFGFGKNPLLIAARGIKNLPAVRDEDESSGLWTSGKDNPLSSLVLLLINNAKLYHSVLMESTPWYEGGCS